MDPAATLSAPSAASILTTAGVQDGLLAVHGVLKASVFVTPFQAMFQVPNNLLLTLMKGDEPVEAIEQGTNLGLFVDAWHAYLAEKQLVKEEVEPNATLLQSFYLL